MIDASRYQHKPLIMQADSFHLVPLAEEHAREILRWRYPRPYDFYDPPEDDHVEYYVSEFLNPALAFHAVINGAERFCGFSSFGLDGQVPGGNYDRTALDIGLGMTPALTGQGRGHAFFSAIYDHAVATFQPVLVRLTVADFNLRAMRLYKHFGFTEDSGFLDRNRVAHTILLREVTA